MNLLALLILWANSLISPGIMDRAPDARPEQKVAECGHDSRSALKPSDDRIPDAPALSDLAETSDDEDDHRQDTATDLKSFPPPVYIPAGLPTVATYSQYVFLRRPIRNLPLRC